MKLIDSKELLLAMEELEKERKIDKQFLIESLEMALITAYKRDYDSAENIKISIDDKTGEIHLYSVKTVVDEVKNDKTEIGKEEAKNISKKLSVGDSVDIEIFPREFGRIAAQTAKQVIIQK